MWQDGAHITRFFLSFLYSCIPRVSLKIVSLLVVLAVLLTLWSSLFSYFYLISLTDLCLHMTSHFCLPLSNGPTPLRGMLKICRLEKIAPFCSQRRGCANYSSAHIKPLNTVLLYFHSSTLKSYTDVPSCGTAPIIIAFQIIPLMNYATFLHGLTNVI